ncbi:Uncharacterized protein GBIM_03381 [Gryllus bimaculatus]|nr:Uncharacterized protein GBIM_03381 [Gryllus bimaculatus]
MSVGGAWRVLAGYLMVRQSGQWGKLCLHNFEKMVANSRASWQVSDLGRAVCKAMTYSDFDRVDRATDEPASGRDGDGDSGSGDLYFELAIADSPGNASDGPSPRSSLEFRPSLCPQRDVVRVSCRDLECGVRPQAVHQWAR